MGWRAIQDGCGGRMDLKKQIALSIIFTLLLASFVHADTTESNFYNSINDSVGTSVNTAFDQAESNITYYLRVPKNATVINGSMNVSGHSEYTLTAWDIIVDEGDGNTEVPAFNFQGFLAGDTEFTHGDNSYDLDFTRIKFTPNQNINISSLEVNIARVAGTDQGMLIDVSIGGTPVREDWNPAWSTGWQTITLDSNFLADANTEYRIEFDQNHGGDNDVGDDYIAIAVDTDGGAPGGYLFHRWARESTTASYAYYSDVNITGSVYYPTNPSIDIANDLATDWNWVGELVPDDGSQTMTFNSTTIQAINDYVDANDADANGYVYVPINMTSDTAGSVQLDTLSMYLDDTATANFVSPTPSNNTKLEQSWIFINVTSDRNQSNFTLEWTNASGTQNLTMNIVNDSSNTYGFINLTNFERGFDFTYTVYVQGNATEQRTIDDTATATWLGPSDPSTSINHTQNYIFVNISTDRNQSNFTLEINSTTNYTMNMVNATSNSYGYYNATNLADGQYDVRVYVQGNSSDTHTIIVDTTAPEYTIVSPVASYNSSSQPITFNFTAIDPLLTMNYNLTIDDIINQSDKSLANNTYANYTFNFSEGNHNWYLKIWDNVSNANTTDTFNFTIDLTAPEVLENESVSSSSIHERDALTITIDVTDPLTGVQTVEAEVMNPGGIKANHTMTGSGDTYTVSLSGTDTDTTGDYYVDFYGTDYAGNTNFSNKDLRFEVTVAAGTGGATGGGGGGGIVVPPKDSDDDGIPDYKDKCPNTPREVFVGRDGCELPEGKLILPTPLDLPELIDNFYIYRGKEPFIRIVHANKELAEVESSNPEVDVSIVNKTDIRIYYLPSNLTSIATLVETEVKVTSTNPPDTKVMRVVIRVIDSRTSKITDPYYPTRPIELPELPGETTRWLNLLFYIEEGVLLGIRLWSIAAVSVFLVGSLLVASRNK